LLLTLVWMTARLVLPLQPQCAHHASTSEAALSVPKAASHAHHAAIVGPLSAVSPIAPTEDGPPPASPCDCVSDCCAATVVAMPASEPPTAGVLNVALGGDVPPRHAAVRLDTRATHRHPPATAPPGFSATA
jgi:hypothetical protein